MKTKKYAIYARTSGDVMKQSMGIISQVHTLQLLAERNSLEVSKVYEEIGSTVAKERPIFESMIKAVKSGQIDGILCVSIDRLTRTLECSQELQKLIDSKRLEILTPSLSISNAEISFLPFFSQAFQRLDLQLRSKRIKEGIAKKRKKTVTYRCSSHLEESEEGGE